MRIALIVFTSMCILLGTTGCFIEKDGCTDPDATNYDPKADNDDNTCEYADPTGTQFITIMKKCADANAIDFSADTVECDTCVGPPNDRGTDIFYNGINFFISVDTACFGFSKLGIASVGQICCLGEIKNVPTSGFDIRASGALSHGYVVRCREGDYARFYVDRLLIDQFGQPEGVEIFYQYPFQ